MPSLKERVRRLEDDLRARPMRHFVYGDLPFAVFVYEPDQEWDLRHEMELLKTRLENDGVRQVSYLSIAELLWQSIDESEGMQTISAYEVSQGFEAAQQQIYDYLSDPMWRTLPDLLTERLATLDTNKDLAFLWRAGALAPDMYRVSNLLDQMKGRTRVPCVLFMPATAEGGDGLRFMDLSLHERRGSYHTKVYVD